MAEKEKYKAVIRKKAFASLIELLVVLAIILFLCYIAFNRYFNKPCFDKKTKQVLSEQNINNADYQTIVETTRDKVNDINKTIENVSNKALYIASISSEMKVVQDAYNKYYKEGNLIEASYILENQFKKINKKTKAVVQMTLTTYDEKLCKILEPKVATTKERFEVLEIMRDNKIPTVVWLDPILPFINDSFENIKGTLH